MHFLEQTTSLPVSVLVSLEAKVLGIGCWAWYRSNPLVIRTWTENVFKSQKMLHKFRHNIAISDWQTDDKRKKVFEYPTLFS